MSLYKTLHICELIHASEQPTAAAAAKLLQSCPTLCDPIDGSPLGSSVSQSSDIKNKKIGIWRSVRRLSEVRAAFSPPRLPQLPVRAGSASGSQAW